jgi:hypothetical protein
MSSTEQMNFDITLLRSTPEYQRSLLKWLLVKVVAEQGAEPLTLPGDDGVPMGVFFPNSSYRNKPPMSEEEYSKLLATVRNTTEDQLLTMEEMMQRLGLVDSPQPSKR